MTSNQYPESVRRTLAIASARGIPCEVIQHEQSGASTQAAARALGVDVAAIVKTLVLETDQGFAVAIIVGNERLDLKAVARHLGCKTARLAKPGRVKEFSAYEVGGVPPIGFENKCPVLISRSLQSTGHFLASAGHECFALRISSDELLRLGTVSALALTPCSNIRLR